MKVCKAIIDDLNEIIDIYHIAVNHMFMENNTNQWSKDNTKFVRLVKKHIDNNEFFVVKNDDEIVGFFAMIEGIDVTYNNIDGKWLNNDPYITIHKIASKYYQKGIASFMLNYVIDYAKLNNIYKIGRAHV